jgi:hypothetical protein
VYAPSRSQSVSKTGATREARDSGRFHLRFVFKKVATIDFIKPLGGCIGFYWRAGQLKIFNSEFVRVRIEFAVYIPSLLCGKYFRSGGCFVFPIGATN